MVGLKEEALRERAELDNQRKPGRDVDVARKFANEACCRSAAVLDSLDAGLRQPAPKQMVSLRAGLELTLKHF